MNLNELDKKNTSTKALRENFSYEFDTSRLSKSQTRTMLSKVRGLINESRKSSEFYKTQNSPAHLKLVFMEQALSSHFNQLMSRPSPRIVFENEEVEKSQVILAAQDMVDSVQKMVEEVSDMLVKELPALTDSIQSEIGANESQQFNSQVAEALSGLNATLQQTQATLKNALDTITGNAEPGFDADMDDTGMDNIDTDTAENDLENDMAPPPMAPEEPKLGSVGRPKR